MVFKLGVRPDSSGNLRLHLPFASFSDVHLGTKQCRAKRLCGFMERADFDHLQLPGDIIDGEYLLKKKTWNFGPWQRQALAHILRKAGQGTKVIFNEGNHEFGLPGEAIVGADGVSRSYRNLQGKTIAGVYVETNTRYVVPATGQIVHIEHGHEHDSEVLSDPKKRRWMYKAGDACLEFAYAAEALLKRLRLTRDFSVAAALKRVTKGLIEKYLNVGDSIYKTHDASDADVFVYGHTHMAGFKRTPGKGKLVINDGSNTEHVQCLAHDEDGNWAILEWHVDRICIFEEGQSMRPIYWKDMGLPKDFGATQIEYDDEYTNKADRVLRIIARMWPAKDRQAALKRKQEAQAALKEDPENTSLRFAAVRAAANPALKIPIPRHRPEKQPIEESVAEPDLAVA